MNAMFILLNKNCSQVVPKNYFIFAICSQTLIKLAKTLKNSKKLSKIVPKMVVFYASIITKPVFIRVCNDLCFIAPEESKKRKHRKNRYSTLFYLKRANLIKMPNT